MVEDERKVVELLEAHEDWVLPVKQWEVYAGLDHTDEFVVRVWAYLKGPLAAGDARFALRKQVRERVDALFSPPPFFVYTFFRDVDEPVPAATE